MKELEKELNEQFELVRNNLKSLQNQKKKQEGLLL